MTNELRQVTHRCRVEEVHHGQITASRDAPVEGIQLFLWRGGICPQPVFDIDAPVHDVGIGDVPCQSLAKTGTHGSKRGSEVSSCSI